MKIRAAVLDRSGCSKPYARSKPLRIAEVDLEPPGPGEVLVRIRAVGLCHSDLSVIDGTRPRPLPMVIGHEAAGIVESIGPGVTDLTVGTHVVSAFVPSCGHCAPCANNRPALCEPGFVSNSAGTLFSGSRRLSENHIALHHHLGVSGFATYAVISRTSLVAIDPTLPFEEAAIFGCAIITGVGAVANTAKVPAGASVAIVGLGGVGLASLLGARALNAGNIIAIDPDKKKRRLAEELGATHVFDPTESNTTQNIKQLLRGGADYAFEMAGNVAALELAFAVTGRGGTTISAGLAAPDARFPLPQTQLVAEERTLKGSYLGSCVPERDIPLYISWYRSGRLPITKLLDQSLKLEELNEAFDRLASGTALRQIVLPD